MRCGGRRSLLGCAPKKHPATDFDSSGDMPFESRTFRLTNSAHCADRKHEISLEGYRTMRLGKTLPSILLTISPAAFAGTGPALHSSTASAALNATMKEPLKVVQAAPSVTFELQPQTIVVGNQPVTITTSWNLNASRTKVVLNAFFSDPANALTASDGNGDISIPSAEIFGRSATGAPATYAAFARPTPNGPSNGGFEIFSQSLAAGVNDLGSRTDSVELRIDLRNHPRLSAGHYHGVLTLIAQVF